MNRTTSKWFWLDIYLTSIIYESADFWYLSVVTGANEHQSRPPTIIYERQVDGATYSNASSDTKLAVNEGF
jgi:hypothetical protein